MRGYSQFPWGVLARLALWHGHPDNALLGVAFAWNIQRIHKHLFLHIGHTQRPRPQPLKSPPEEAVLAREHRLGRKSQRPFSRENPAPDDNMMFCYLR